MCARSFGAETQFVSDVRSPHLLPGIDAALCAYQGWTGPDACAFDGAGVALAFIHGPAAK